VEPDELEEPVEPDELEEPEEPAELEDADETDELEEPEEPDELEEPEEPDELEEPEEPDELEEPELPLGAVVVVVVVAKFIFDDCCWYRGLVMLQPVKGTTLTRIEMTYPLTCLVRKDLPAIDSPPNAPLAVGRIAKNCVGIMKLF